MSWPLWLVVLFASVLLIPGAFSIEVGFSAGNGGEYSSIGSSYDVGTDVSVSEESSANHDQATIENVRTVSGTGEINAVQTYSGSGSYKGSAILSSQGVSGSLKGNAILTPQSLTANQGLSLNGRSVDTGMSLANKGDSANIGVALSSGMIDSNQVIQTGSVYNDISVTLNAQSSYIRQSTLLQGIQDSTSMTFGNSNSKPFYFNSIAGSNSGISNYLQGCYADLKADKYIEGKDDGSKAEIHAIVTNPSIPYNWNYMPSFSGIVQTLTAPDADYISAEAYATNGKGDQSKVGVYITDGSLFNYKSSAYFSGAKATSYQEFYKAEGNDIRMNRDKNLEAGPIPVPVGWQGVGSNSYAEIKGEKSQVKGYSNSGSSERISSDSPDLIADPRHSGESIIATSYQKIDYAKGDRIDVGSQAFDSVKGESANAFSTVKDGSIFLYSDRSTADLSPSMVFSSLVGQATALVDINAVGSSIDVRANADNTKDATPVKEDGFKDRNVKLSARIGAKAESNKEPEEPIKEESKGLAILALRPNAVDLGPFGKAGHVGVGIWNDDGTWTIGAVENPGRLPSVLPGSYNGGWQETARTWLEVADMLNGEDRALKRGDHKLDGGYDKFKIIHVSDPHPDQANTEMDDLGNRGYWIGDLKYGIYTPLITDDLSVQTLKLLNRKLLDATYSENKYWPRRDNTCLDATVDVLYSYAPGENLPHTEFRQFPKEYFSNLNVKEYSWNSDWNTYTNELLPDFPSTPLTPPADEPPAPPSPSWTVNVGELIQSYIDRAMSGDTITISPGIFNENLVIDKSLTLKGAGNTESGTVVDGTRSGSVFTIGKVDPNIDVYLYDLLIRDGLSTIGGGIYNHGKLTVDGCSVSGNEATQYGGGIFNDGTTELDGSSITGNTATSAGGIMNGGIMIINGGSTTGNTASYGGGIVNYGTMNLDKSTITGNTVTGGGGGIYNEGGTMTINGSSITANTAGTNTGGGIINTGTMTINGGSITGNTADYFGGGIYNANIMTINGGSITGNTADFNGGGIYNGAFSTNTASIMNLHGCSITGNTAANNGGGIYNRADSTMNLYGGSIIGNTANYGGGIYSSGGQIRLDGIEAAVKSNNAHLPSPSEISWYQGWGVYLEKGTPTTTGDFNPAKQVTDNTRILNLPIWTEV